MIIHTLSLTTIYLVVFHGNALQYGDRQEPLFKSVTSIAKKSNKHENRVQILATKYQDRVFGSINNSPSFSSPSSFIENSNPVSLTIAMKLQPKRRYRKLKLPGVEGGSDDVTNPIILPSHQVNSAVGLLLKRTGHINEIPSSRTRKPKYRVSSISVPSSKGTNRQQSALAKFELRKQKTGLQSKPTEPTLLPIKLTSEKPPTPGSFHSSNKRKVKLDKKSMSLVGSLITAPPSDKSKLTIPKPIIDWSDRRHIQPNRPASSMATNRLKSAAGNDEIPSSSKKREFLYTGKVRSTTPLSIQFETNKPSYNHKINLIKEKNIPPVNAVKNLGNLGTVLLASGQLGQINKSKITRIPLEPLDYETELDKNHSDNGMDKHKQPSPYEMSPFAYIEAVSENVENSSDSHPYYPRTSANQMVQTEKPISKPNENIYVTPSTSTDYSGYKRRNGIKNHDIQTKYELPHKSVSSSTENRRNSQIKYDYGHFGERMVPLRSSDITRTTTTTTTTTTEPPITAATNQPTEPSNVYFDDSVTPNSNEALDSELETVKENEIDGKVTSSTADPLIEGSLISGSTANPWSWDDTASENDGLLVSPLFASSNDEDDPNHEIQRNQQSHHETTTANYYAAEQPIEDNNQANSANERTAFTKSPDSGDSNGRDTTRYYFPFELKYLAELCKNNSAFGLSSFSSTTTSTSTTTPMPTTEPVEELTLEKSQVDQATLSYGDRPFAIGSIRGQKSGYNMKKVAYQYKQWGDQWMRSTQSDAAPRNERRQRKLTSPPLNRAKPQTTTTIASDDDYFFELSTLKPTTEESSVIKNEEAMKTARPILKHEYHYEPPFPDHGSHGEPIGANLFDEIDLKATETTDPAESHSSSDKSNDGVSFDEDKNIFENFDSEVPVSRIRPDNEEINDKQPTNPKIKKLNQKLSAPPSVAPASQTTAVQSSPKRYPASKTLQNSGGLSSSILDELAGIPGGAGRDYPALPKIPEEIDFSCKGRTSGFYADMNLRCQVYHHCNHGSMQSFMCPNGTIFNQEISVCSWWFNVDCGKSEQFYKLNDKPAPEPTKPPKPIPINVSEASINSSRRPKKNRIIYKQTPALEESFFREKPRSYSTTTNTFYINRNRRRHRYHHHHNRDDMFPFF